MKTETGCVDISERWLWPDWNAAMGEDAPEKCQVSSNDGVLTILSRDPEVHVQPTPSQVPHSPDSKP